MTAFVTADQPAQRSGPPGRRGGCLGRPLRETSNRAPRRSRMQASVRRATPTTGAPSMTARTAWYHCPPTPTPTPRARRPPSDLSARTTTAKVTPRRWWTPQAQKCRSGTGAVVARVGVGRRTEVFSSSLGAGRRPACRRRVGGRGWRRARPCATGAPARRRRLR